MLASELNDAQERDAKKAVRKNELALKPKPIRQ